jgi:guanylate kinase
MNTSSVNSAQLEKKKQTNPHFKYLVIIGEAGTGKDTLLDMLVDGNEFVRNVPYTTRAPREGEIDGKTYYFIAPEKFEEMQSENLFKDVTAYTIETKQGEKKIVKFGEFIYDFLCVCIIG